MSTPTVQAVVAEYLARLRAAAWVLSPEQAEDLISGIAEHLAEAQASGAAADEAGVRTVLDRLGEPEELVAAAREEGPEAAVPDGVAFERPRALHEAFAVGLLTVGSFVPVLGWLAGVLLLWTSRRWTALHKSVGTLLVPGGPGLVLLLASMPARTCSVSTSLSTSLTVTAPQGPGGAWTDAPLTSPEPFVATESTCSGFALPGGLGVVLLLLWLVAPFVVAGWLWRCAQRAAAQEAPVARRAGAQGWGSLEVAGVILLCLGNFVVPVVAPLVGLGLVLASPSWSARQRNIAGGLTLVPLALVVLSLLALFLFPLSALPATGELLLAFLAAALGPVAAGVYLALTIGRER